MTTALERAGEKNARVADQIALLEDGIKELAGKDEVQAYFKAIAHFHNYSMFNQMLIWQRMKDATHVGGFKMWKDKFNRYVRKGESGIPILFPRFVKKEDRTDEEPGSAPIGYGVGYVFDVSQTDGDPMPAAPVWTELTGTSSIARALLKMGATWAEREGVAVVLDASSPFDRPGTRGTLSTRNGDQFQIWVDDTLSDNQQAQVLLHEMGHWLLRVNDDRKGLEYDDEEVIVDAASCVACEYFGLDTKDVDTVYILSWAKGDVAQFKKWLRPISKLARELIDGLEKEVTVDG